MLGAIKDAVKGLLQNEIFATALLFRKKDIFGTLGEGFLLSIVSGVSIEGTHFFHTLSLMVRKGVGIKVKCCGCLGMA